MAPNKSLQRTRGYRPRGNSGALALNLYLVGRLARARAAELRRWAARSYGLTFWRAQS